MKCPFNKDRRGKECVHNIKGNCTGFCANCSLMEKAEKIKLMRKIAKEGHSFPHYDTCKTCEDDFDEVYNLGKKKKEDEMKSGDLFPDKTFRFTKENGINYISEDAHKVLLKQATQEAIKDEIEFLDNELFHLEHQYKNILWDGIGEFRDTKQKQMKIEMKATIYNIKKRLQALKLKLNREKENLNGFCGKYR